MHCETITYKNYTIKISQDEYPNDPREWDNLGTMICFHNKYDLGDRHDYNSSDFNNWNELKAQIVKDCDPCVIFPLYLYDHSGITISHHGFSYCDPAGWDWGGVGFHLVSKQKVRKEYGVKKISKKLHEKIIRVLESEIQTYNDCLTGSVFYYNIENDDGESIDSCSGFLGSNFEDNGLLENAKGAIDYYIESKRKDRQNKLKILVRNRVPLNKRSTLCT